MTSNGRTSCFHFVFGFWTEDFCNGLMLASPSITLALDDCYFQKLFHQHIHQF